MSPFFVIVYSIIKTDPVVIHWILWGNLGDLAISGSAKFSWRIAVSKT